MIRTYEVNRWTGQIVPVILDDIEAKRIVNSTLLLKRTGLPAKQALDLLEPQEFTAIYRREAK